MVGNREKMGAPRLWLLASVVGVGGCTSVLGIEELHEGGRGGGQATSGGSASNGGSDAGGANGNGASGSSAAAGTSNSGGSGGSSSAAGGTAGDASGGTGGTVATSGTVHGRVVDLWGQTLPNVLIQVGDETGTTDTKGEFTFEDVPAEYDASLYITIPNPSSDYGWVYQGVTRRDPTFEVYDAREGRETPVSVSSVNGPYPLGATDAVAYSIALTDGVLSGTLGTMPGVEVRPEWFGPASTIGTAHGLSWSFNVATQAPTKYSAYGSKLIALEDDMPGDPITFDFAPQTITAKTIEGAITPVGQGDRVNQLFVRFESHGTIRLMEQDDAPNTFSYLVPALPQASIMLAASEGNDYDGPFAIAHADGLNGGDTDVKLTIPAPARPLKPTSSSAVVGDDQVFELQPGTGNDGPFVVVFRRGDRANYALFVVTQETKLQMPEVAGGAFDLDKNLSADSYYTWAITTHGDYASVDAMLGPNGFLDAFGYSSGTPVGPRQTSGSYTTSVESRFEKAP
ncbi:MAG: carboxypeptidase regulatory-like domain-containing protein [Myxococcales bacterium]|nr:MAG: carboxypeptidase regulatory-like domain-containing protein [Myxococcales bacterium]